MGPVTAGVSALQEPARKSHVLVGQPSDSRGGSPALEAMVIKERMAGELKKHVGAVHVKGRLSLLQRKVSNILLLNAYDELPEQGVFEHTIRLRTLADVAGFDSNDHQLLREALEALVDVKIKWNVLDRDGEEEWGVSAFLSQAVTKGGLCRYAYPPELRRKLFNPEIYARINLSVQERFGSSYALALYENCVRFRKVGTTGWIDLDQWRDLLGVEEGQYEQFKYLNRDVLKPAVKEVNGFSDIRVKMETKRERRRIVALKFSIKENPQLMLELEGSGGQAARALGAKALPDPRAMAPEPDELLGPLQRRLLAFGLSDSQALDVSTEFGADRIARNLDHVEAELERGRAIKNVPAFTLDAIRTDYRKSAAQGETEVERTVKRKQQAKEERAAKKKAAARRREEEEAARRAQAEEEARRQEEERAARLDAAWAALGADEQARIEQRAVARMREEIPFVYNMYQRERAKGKSGETLSIAVRSTLRGFRYDALEEATA